MHRQRTFPIHLPPRRFDRDAPTGELLAPDERRPADHLPLWPYLYRFYDSGQRLLYLGITTCTATRLDSHRRRSEWWPLAEYIAISVYRSYADVIDAERFALRAERPPFNRQGVQWRKQAALQLLRPPEEAADLLLRQAKPEFLSRLVELLQDPQRTPQPAPPPARFSEEVNPLAP